MRASKTQDSAKLPAGSGGDEQHLGVLKHQQETRRAAPLAVEAAVEEDLSRVRGATQRIADVPLAVSKPSNSPKIPARLDDLH